MLTALQGNKPRQIEKGLEDWNLQDRMLTYRGRIYIPKDNNMELRQNIVKQFHENPAYGHPGEWRTVELVQREYWWPLMTSFIREYHAKT